MVLGLSFYKRASRFYDNLLTEKKTNMKSLEKAFEFQSQESIWTKRALLYSLMQDDDSLTTFITKHETIASERNPTKLARLPYSAERFIDFVQREAKMIRKFLKNKIPMERLSSQQWREYNKATTCKKGFLQTHE